MKSKRPKVKANDSTREIAELRARLAEAEETLEAIRSGAVDALVVAGTKGDQVFALKGAETPYRLLVEAMHEAALMLNAEGTILYCNGRLAEMVRCSSGCPIGKALAEFVAPDQVARLKHLLTAVPAEGRKGEFWLQSPEGGSNPVPVLLAVRSLGADGSQALSVVATDLTTQKAYEGMLHQSKAELEERVRLRTAELRDQREYFRVTLTSIGDAVMAFDTAGKATFLNPIAAALTGWPEEQALGRPVAEVFRILDERTRQPGEDIVARVLEQKRIVTMANGMALIARDGSAIPIEDSAAPILDATGNITGAVLVFHEVTEKRRALEALRQSEERFKLSMEATNDGLWDWDATTNQVYYSPAYYRILGYEPGSFPGTLQAWKEMVHPQDLERTLKVNMDCVEGRSEGFAVEYRMKARTGEWRWILGRGKCITRDERGCAIRLIGTHVDLTERKRAEEDLRKAKEDLAQANVDLERRVRQRTLELQDLVEELEHFSYTITHDMRAPLRAMQGFAALMDEVCGDCLKVESKEYLDRIRVSAGRMDRLITDALQYSKVGREKMSIGSVDTHALLAGIIRSYPSMQPPEAQIRIDGPIPKVLGNEAGLTQCFANLLGNAVKFVRPGEVPEVRVYAESREGFVRVWFEDKGVGIPKMAQGRLFQMFQRANKKFEGTGVGLALAKKVTERMGGRIGVESDAGQGSRFWVDLKPAT